MSRLAGTGEGVKVVKPEGKAPTVTGERPRRKQRSLARSVRQIARGRELRRNETESEEIAWRLLRGLRVKGFSRLLKNYVAAALRRHHTLKTLGFWRDKPAATTR